MNNKQPINRLTNNNFLLNSNKQKDNNSYSSKDTFLIKNNQSLSSLLDLDENYLGVSNIRD